MPRNLATVLPGVILTCGAMFLAGCSGTAPSTPAPQVTSAVPSSASPSPSSATPISSATPSIQSSPATADSATAPSTTAATSAKATSAKPTAKPTTAKPTTAKPTTAAPAVKLDPRCTTGDRVLCADKSKGRIYYVQNGVVVKTFAARFGRTGHTTDEGAFRIYMKDPLLISYKYEEAKMPWSMCYNGSECVHYSYAFAANTNPMGSHGCINIKDMAGIKALYAEMKVGDTVIVYRSATVA